MFLKPLLVFSLTLLVSCASEMPRRAFDSDSLGADTTPKSWRVGATWTFVTKDRSGKLETLSFRITDKPVCASGQLLSLEDVEGQKRSFADFPSKAGYKVKGRCLVIELMCNWNDAHDEIHGELTDDGFEGERSEGGHGRDDFTGTVVGRAAQ
jgi:hypothetical protein